MTWLAILWLGIGVACLVRESMGGRRWLASAGVGIACQLVLAALALDFDGPSVIVVIVCAALVVAYEWWHHAPPTTSRDALIGLGLIGFPTALVLTLSGVAPEASGLISGWLRHLPFLPAGTKSAGHVLALGAAFILNLAAGNTIVRDVLVASGVSPAAQGPTGTPPMLTQPRLRGGRVLGPMERVLILGFGAGGNLAAAALVIAAKGLVRFPELSATSRSENGPRIDEVTEYFLIGSFASLLLALGCVAVTT